MPIRYIDTNAEKLDIKWRISMLDVKDIDAVFYHINFNGGLDWATDAINFIKKNQRIGVKYIISGVGEAPFKTDVLRVINFDDNVIYIDSGIDSFHTRHVNLSYFFSFKIRAEANIREQNKDFTPIPFFDRDKYFVCLNRKYKIHRTAFVKLLHTTGLNSKGIITLNHQITGTAGNQVPPPGYDYKLYNQGDKVMSPVTIDLSNNEKFKVPLAISPIFNNLGDNALINMINETSFFYNTDPTYVNPWNRVFVTEKTVKSFIMHQLPLFLTVDGHVQYLKDNGFDLFEDFINHSYDSITDPLLKTTAVFGELYRLCNEYTIDEIRAYCEKNKERFLYNVNNCDIVYTKELDTALNKIKILLES